MERGHEIKVLDHGYVRYVDSMGTDESVVEAARMSTGRGFVSWEPYRRCKKCDGVRAATFTVEDVFLESGRGGSKDCEHDWQDFPRGDLGILDFMYRNRHATPFEFCELHIEVQAPLMVFREWHRHRTQSYSEFSARYSQMPDLHYLPTLDRFQRQSSTNRQGSAETIPQGDAAAMRDGLRRQQESIYRDYDADVRYGLTKEVARLNTPVSRYSKMRAKTDLRNWLAFLLLRMSPNAQWEIRQYANAVVEIVKAIWPRTYELFEEHDLCGVRLSRSEVALLRRMLDTTGDFSISSDPGVVTLLARLVRA